VRTKATLEGIFKAFEDSVSAGKLKLLRRYFGAAVGSDGLACPVDDPMIPRRQLIEQMRREDVSSGTIQALVQFYMGIIRRAALAGLIPPPPEGPWTRSWQSVLDLAEETTGAKAPLRSLAGWATDKALEPDHLEDRHFQEWLEDLKREESAATAVREVLQKWARQPAPPAVASDETRAERLRRKAANGSVALD
jgi:hypothetical protein